MNTPLPPLVVLHYPTRVKLGRPSFELALSAMNERPVRAYYDVYLCVWRPAPRGDGASTEEGPEVREVIVSRDVGPT